MKNRKGFTLVELIIVIVIVGVLSIVAVPVYKGYTKKAMATEAKALISSIVTAEKIYYAEYNHYKEVSMANCTAYNKDLDVDARSNKYFTTYAIISDDLTTSFSAGVLGNQGSGADYISMGVVYSTTDRPTFYEFYEDGGFQGLGIDY